MRMAWPIAVLDSTIWSWFVLCFVLSVTSVSSLTQSTAMETLEVEVASSVDFRPQPLAAEEVDEDDAAAAMAFTKSLAEGRTSRRRRRRTLPALLPTRAPLAGGFLGLAARGPTAGHTSGGKTVVSTDFSDASAVGAVANMLAASAGISVRTSQENAIVHSWLKGGPLSIPSRQMPEASVLRSFVAEPTLTLDLHLRGVTVLGLHKSVAHSSVVEFLQQLLAEFSKAKGLEQHRFTILDIHGRYLTWYQRQDQRHTENEVVVHFSVAPVEVAPDKPATWVLDALNARLQEKNNTLLTSPFASAMRNASVTTSEATWNSKNLMDRLQAADAREMGEVLLPLALCSLFTGALAWLLVV